MATSNKDVQQNVKNQVSTFRENDKAVYVLRVVIMAVVALVMAYVLYVAISFVDYKRIGFDFIPFSEFLTFGGFITFVITSAVVIAAAWFGLKGMRVLWERSEALNKSSDKDGVDNIQAV